MPSTTTNLALRYPAPSDPPDGPGAVGNLALDVEDRFGRTAAAASQLAAGTRYGQRAVVGTVEYRWNGSAWKAWDSDWTSYTYSMSNLAFGTSTLLYRYRAGKVAVQFYGSGTVSVAGAGNVITMALPVLADTSGKKPYGRNRAIDSGNAEFPLDIEFTDSGNVKFQFWSGSPVKITDLQTTNLQTWNQGDLMILSFEYDPA